MIFVFIPLFFGVVLQKFCFCVPPIPTDSLMNDVREIKDTVFYLKEKTKILDSHSIHSLDILLTTIDVNIKSLQEKAHIWDTFQLHVAAWNEQLSSLDRKLDILNNAQRKIDDLDSNLNNLLNSMTKRINDISSKTNLIEDSIKDIYHKLDDKKQDRSLFEEFAARGILSTVKQIDKKIDKIQLTSFQRNETCFKLNEDDNSNTINNNNNILKDISSKVDVIFDKLSEKDDLIQEGFIEDHGSGENVENQNYNCDSSLKRILNRLNIPFKKTGNVLENVLNKINKVQNDTEALKRIFKESNINVQTVLNQNFKSQNENISKLIESCSKSKEIMGEIQFDYTFCNSFENISGVFSFDSMSIKNNAPKYWKERLCKEDWLVIQKRYYQMFNIQENFNRSWNDYKVGFGELDKEFWIGNDLLHYLSYQNDLRLRIELENFDGIKVWAEYDTFKVRNETEKYRLEINGYKGIASDSFSSHNNVKFSTFDNDNDDAPDCCPCAVSFGSGWWFNSCFEANLNGVYYISPDTGEYYKGIIWEHWLGNYSLKKTIMMVKAKGNVQRYPDLHKIPVVTNNQTKFGFEDP